MEISYRRVKDVVELEHSLLIVNLWNNLIANIHNIPFVTDIFPINA